VPGVREVHNVRVMEVDGLREVSLHLKLPSQLRLEQAHAIANQVEAAIRAAEPELSDVHTHIEPLSDIRDGELPVDDDVAGEREVITAVVRELTGREPENLRLRRGQEGRLVALLTICVDPGQRLREAHELATEIEERVRRRAPAIAEVVVHTEPR
jgi:divalent metal cation (Fe/Co/Zn/Cd) transporter